MGPLSRLAGKPPFSPWLSKNVLPLTKAANGPNSAISLTQTFDRTLFYVCDSLSFGVQKEKNGDRGTIVFTATLRLHYTRLIPDPPYSAFYTPKYYRLQKTKKTRLNACFFNEMAPFWSFAALLLKGLAVMAEMEGSPQEEMANPQGMNVFAVERPGLPEDSCLFLLCMECNRRHSYLLRICRLFGVRYTVVGTGGDTVLEVRVLLSWVLKLLEWTLVNRAYQLTRTLLFLARAKTVESTSSTVEDGGRERCLWSGCEPKPVSADQIHSTHGAQSPRAHETARSIVCES